MVDITKDTTSSDQAQSGEYTDPGLRDLYKQDRHPAPQVSSPAVSVQSQQQGYEDPGLKEMYGNTKADSDENMKKGPPPASPIASSTTNLPFDLGAGAATGIAGALAVKKAEPPFGLLNLAENLKNTNASLNTAQQIHAANTQELNSAQQAYDFLHSNDAIKANIPEDTHPHVRSVIMNEEPLSAGDKWSGKVVGNMGPGGKGVTEAAQNYQINKGLSGPEASTYSANREGVIVNKDYLNKLANDVASTKQQIAKNLEPQRAESTARLNNAKMNADVSGKQVADLSSKASQQNATLTAETSKLRPQVAEQYNNIASGTAETPAFGSRVMGIVRKLGIPAMAASIPYEGRQALEEYQKGNYGSALKHGAGALGGAAGLAGEGLMAAGLAPELGAGLATAGALTGLGVIGHDIYENLPAISNFISGKKSLNPPLR